MGHAAPATAKIDVTISTWRRRYAAIASAHVTRDVQLVVRAPAIPNVLKLMAMTSVMSLAPSLTLTACLSMPRTSTSVSNRAITKHLTVQLTVTAIASVWRSVRRKKISANVNVHASQTVQTDVPVPAGVATLS